MTTQRDMNETSPRTRRARKKLRVLLLVVGGTVAPILVAVMLTYIGSKVGPQLPPSVAHAVNVVVARSFFITVGGIVVLLVLIFGIRSTFKSLSIGFIGLFCVAIFSPTFLHEVHAVSSSRSFRDANPHYAITEGIVSSSDHRTAIEGDCARETLQKRSQSEFHHHASLQSPEEYGGRYVVSVSANTLDSSRGRVVVIFREARDRSAWPFDIAWTNAGDTLVWEGICTPRGMDWLFSASLPKAYRQDEHPPRWWLPE